MNHIRMEHPKLRRDRGYDPLPLDPRDPDILRAKQHMDVLRAQERCRQMTANASESDMSSTTSDIRIAILSANLGGLLQALLEDPVVRPDRACRSRLT